MIAFFLPPNFFTNKPIIIRLIDPMSAGNNLKPNTVFPKIDIASFPMTAIDGGADIYPQARCSLCA